MFSLSFYKFVPSIHVILHSDTEYKPLPPPRHNKAAMLLSHLICRMLMFCLFFVFIYIYWCPIYTMMSVSLSSSTVGATSNTETAYSSGTPEFTSGFVVFCRSLFAPFPCSSRPLYCLAFDWQFQLNLCF